MDGLSQAAAVDRLKRDGPNQIAQAAPPKAWRMLLAQFGSPMIWLLLGACVLSAALGEWMDAVAIGVLVTINAVVGFTQEYRAERALLALRSLTAPRARVLRDGAPVTIPAAEVVVEDVLLLEAGDLVAADGTLLDAHALRTIEAALTGESLPSEKKAQPSAANAPLAEQHDHVFMGTAVSTGTGQARVTSVGMQTQLGKVAHLLSTAQETATPLQERLSVVSRSLMLLCLGITGVVALLGWYRGEPWLLLLMSSVSLAVAAVPEGLPAVVTIALALGVQRMAKRNVLVRRLPAVETLGCATVICTDKTGTLTTGSMKVRLLWGPDEGVLINAAASCCDAVLGAGGKADSGDPTELAILAAAAEKGVHAPAIESANARVDVSPFDAEKKRMAILRADGVLYMKGALEALLPLCTRGTEGAQEQNDKMAAEGLRVLAVATGTGAAEGNLTLVGLVGMADPPRPEAMEAVKNARAAGITVVMITGDHPVTARAIAREMGILRDGDNEAERVHARATPEDKLKIVREWKAKGHVVAMTGDGVNDAPALREAHIGLAMGKGGTEVTREAAHMILTDDNFASIIAAVQEGRGIYDNIRKTLVYLLTGNAAELAVMLGASLMGLPLPLLPLHLLWINLVTDGFPALALVMDPADPDVLARPPRPSTEPMLGRHQWFQVVWVGAVEAVVVLATYAFFLKTEGVDNARANAFTVLVLSELARALGARSESHMFWKTGVGTAWRLLLVLGVSCVLQILILTMPATSGLFGSSHLGWNDMVDSLLLALIPVTALELSKLLHRRKPAAG